ncbi:MAG TPA: S9 family peptidase [Bacteroidales bacterium]|nr:S9 family peptidase [Bacteroidales bacterium]
MKKTICLLFFIAAAITFACVSENKIKPPVAEKIPHEVYDGRIDNYYWIRLTDEQKSSTQPDEQTKKVLAYLEAENEYGRAVLKHTEELQKKIYDELIGRMKQNDETVPYFDNGYYYYTKYYEGKEYPVYCRKKESLNAPEEIILDVNRIAEGKSYCSVSGLAVSPDNGILAYGADFLSRRKYTIYFVDLKTGTLLPDIIENTSGNIVWANDSKHLFYTVRNPLTLRAEKVMRHRLATLVSDDREVYFEPDETFSVYINRTKSRRYILINSTQTLSTEVRYINSSKPESQPVVFEPRQRNHEYSVDHIGNEFYIRTNADSAYNFKLMKTSEKNTGKENWIDVVPHRKDVLFEEFELFNNFIVLNERIKGLSTLRILNKTDNSDHYIDFGEETYTCSININPDPASSVLRYSYSSLTTPNSVYDYDMITREKKLMKQDEVLGGFDPANYESKRLWARAADSTMIPISLVYRKGFTRNGKAPLLLYGYGAYGNSTEPSFRPNIISLLDRGFVFAIAHVRGGSEMGRYWYEDGKLLKKKNTFTDFNDCAQYLVNEKYTSTDRLFAQGGSAGGLLIGAVINMRPDLYKGVIAAVPFVDIVTTMLDPTIPLTTFEWDEWGDPRKKEYYDYMLSYSPYDQVKKQKYPNIIVTTGFWDSQVQYWEPVKWVAKLREMNTGNSLIVMDINMTAGHSGASGRFERNRVTALQYAFILDLAGIRE